jgi:hypothetical protein
VTVTSRTRARTASRGRSLLRDTRGAAYTEVIVMMPVFISLFAGIGFFHHLYSARMDAGTLARRCAWAYANGGCDAVPAGCEGVTRGSAPPTSPSPAQGDVDEARGQVAQLDDEMPMPAASSILDAILGTTTTTRADEQVPMPQWIGGGERPATCRYAVACNERERTLGSLVRDAFCGKVSSMGFGGVFGCN